ncbi:MAG: hypothetical protein LBR79_01195 [Oscillospiraceae bacterium]|nr:hypothetical protein [Oscillospiraceae bacterium]
MKFFLFPRRGRGKNKNATVLKSFYYICYFPTPWAGEEQKCHCFKKLLLYPLLSPATGGGKKRNINNTTFLNGFCYIANKNYFLKKYLFSSIHMIE